MNDPSRDFGSGASRLAELTDMVIDQIRKLSDLNQEGILTDEEFAAKKQELLSRI